jgi:NADH:ubiquinone oxidoreductase subunit 6 (subunit J)
MSNSQNKAVSIILLVLGVVAIGLSIIGFLEVNDANAQMEQMDKAMGGLMGSMGKSMGMATEASYTRPFAFLGTGLLMAIIGFKMLGKKNTVDAE